MTIGKIKSSMAIQERRDNRKGFIENMIKGFDIPVSFNKTVSITDAMKIVANSNEEFSSLYESEIDDNQMKNLWLNGGLGHYAGLIHLAVLSLADYHIGEEL